ncbi:MAG TPA: ROK family protein, partial [Alphaproteobacteria bacterium]
MRIGIDFGGTKTEIIALDARNGKELYRQRIPTVRNDYQATLQAMKGLVDTCEQTLGQKGTVGVAIPGSISSVHGKVKNSNSVWTNGHPFDKDLSEVLGRPVRMQNDANCFAVSEATDGAAAGKKSVFGVIIGTGCGGGLVMDGAAVQGFNGMGGEWGHNPLPMPRVFMDQKSSDKLLNSFDQNTGIELNKTIYPNKSGVPEYFTTDMAWNEYPGDWCYCGRRNCQELWISGTGFKNDYFRVTGESLS